MTSVLLLPDPAVLALVDLEIDAATNTITAFAVTTSPEAKCPLCHQPASRVQSRYVRTLVDLPCSGQGVRWLVQVRRFWCENAACARKIFDSTASYLCSGLCSSYQQAGRNLVRNCLCPWRESWRKDSVSVEHGNQP